MNLETNKIFAAVLVAGIIAFVCGLIAETAFHQEPVKSAMTVPEGEGVAAGSGGAAAAPAEAEPITALLASADIERGKSLSKACAACHTFDKGGADRLGPNLWNTVGNKKGHAPAFAYSAALKDKAGVWGYDELNAFLWKPKTYLPGTKMNYAGMKKPQDRADLIAWLRTLSDSPQPLP